MYDEIIKRYRQKKIKLFAIVLIIALILTGLFLGYIFIWNKENISVGDWILYAVLFAFILFILYVTFHEIVKVPQKIKEMMVSLGYKNEAEFAQMINSCRMLPGDEGHLVGQGLLFDMMNFIKYDLKNVNEIKKIAHTNKEDTSYSYMGEYKVAVIFKDGSQCIIGSSGKNIDEVYKIISDEWKAVC